MVTNIVLLGHTGMLGRYVYSYFKDSEFLLQIVNGFRVTKDTTVSDIDAVLKACEVDETTCVINCIGAIPQRESAPHQFYVVNGVFPHLLWSACQRYGCKMIQPTTDCVFSGKKGNYTETDAHDELGHYGVSKSVGEPNCTVIRTSIIGEELANKKSFLEFVRNSTGEIKGWTNHMWNGITCLEYCKVLNEILAKNMFWSGVRHIASPTAASKYEMACMIRKTYGVSIDILEARTDQACDKTLTTSHVPLFKIAELSVQIDDLRNFDITKAMSWSSKDGRITIGANASPPINILKPQTPPAAHPLPAWAGPNTVQLQIETLLSSKQKIAYIKRNLQSGMFYNHVRIQKQPVTPDTISIVMTSANRSRQTLYTLDTIGRDTYSDVQIILVDDSTTDPVHVSQLEGYPFTIDFIQIKKDAKIWGNPCVNYNIGFKFVEGGKVILQNAEVCHVGNVVQYVRNSVDENSYVAFDVASVAGFPQNDTVYLKNTLTTEVYSEDALYGWLKWYQSPVHRNKRYHFLTAMSRSTFDKIGGFSYDYTIGNGYDDDDLVMKIEYLGIPILSVAHTDTVCGGLHLFHAPSGGDWGGKLPLNDIVFNEKEKRCKNAGSYVDFLSI